MSPRFLAAMLAIAIGSGACAGRTTPAVSNATQRLTSATVTFTTLGDGKDEKSAVTVQLLRNGNELGAEAMTSGTEFDDNSMAPPVAMSIRGPFDREDTSTGQLRLRLAPDGDDTWTFNVGLALRYSDDTQQNYSWSAIRLDEKAPERTLVLSGAQTP
jgi:hypothetical protein